MFCKNCGREIDQKTLEKLMRPSGEPAVCPNCGEEVETAEFCGGFWGLVASSEALQGGSGEETGAGAGRGTHRKSRKAGSSAAKPDRAGQQNEESSRRGGRIPGVTEADRMLARMILEEEGAGDGAVNERSGGDRINTAAGSSDQKSGSAGEKSGSSGKKSGSSDEKSGNPDQKSGSSGKKVSGSGKKTGGSGRGTSRGEFRPAAAAILAAAVLAGFLFGRFLPFSSGSGSTGAAGTEQTAEGPDGRDAEAQTAENPEGEDADIQADSLAQADDLEADAQGGDNSLSGQDKEGAANTLNAEEGTGGDQNGSSPQSASDAAGTEASGYNMIRRTLTEVNGLMIEDAVLYYGTQDSGITFDGKKLRNEWLAGAGGVSYIKTGIGESDGTLTELDRIYYDKNGEEINNSSGYSRVKYEYDDQGALEKKKYYAMVEGRDKDTKICTSECQIRESGEGNVSVEIFKLSEEAADNEAFRYKKTERTFMSQDSELPGALSTVRYFLQESDPEPAREEIHEYSRVDGTASEEGAGDYDYFVEETIRVFVSKEAGEKDSAAGGATAALGLTGETAKPASSDSTSEDGELQEMLQSAETAETASSGSTYGSAELQESPESTDSAGQAASDSGSYPEDKEGGQVSGGSVMTDLITIRYYFEENDDQPRLVRMGYYQDGSPVEGKEGYSGFTRSYSDGQTVREDHFFGIEGRTDNEDRDSSTVPGGENTDSSTVPGGENTDSSTVPGGENTDSLAVPGGENMDSSTVPDSRDAESEVSLVSEEPLLTGEVVPGYYSAESPWLFLIP